MSLPTHIYQEVTARFGQAKVANLKVGETIRLHQRVKEGKKTRIQVFEGIVIATKHGQGLNGTFKVRRIAAGGVGVEKTFSFHLPSIEKIQTVKKAKINRAKLYYLRERFGKRARFSNEKITDTTWEKQLDEEVGEAETKNEPKTEVKEEKPVENLTKDKKEEQAEAKTESKEEEKSAAQANDKKEDK